MKKFVELTTEEITKNSNYNLDIKSTKEVTPYPGIIGQDRALKAIISSMQIMKKGFNLYVSGSFGIGKTEYVTSVVNNLAKDMPVPSDFCYIYNFDDPSSPLVVELEAGCGYELKTDMNQFVNKLLFEFSTKLCGDTYEKEKRDIRERYGKMKQKILADFDKYTFEQGFKIKYDKDGISFSPVYNGNIIDETEFNKLSENDKNYFKTKSPSIQEETLKILKSLDSIDLEAEKTITQWESNIATFVSTQCIKDLKVKYKNNLKLQNFFYNIQSDIVNNVEFYKQYEEYLKSKKNTADVKQTFKSVYPFENYKVNLIIDNDATRCAPIEICKNPTYYDLFGKLEYENTPQGIKTNLMMLKPGIVHKANGGFVILNIKDIANAMPIWEALKRVIKNGEIKIDATRDLNINANLPTLSPEPIPVTAQFILIGNETNYRNLCKIDPDFKKLFKVKAEFEDTCEKNDINIKKVIGYMAYVCESNKLLPFNKDAIEKVIDYSSYVAGDSTKLSSNHLAILDIMIEAEHVAKKNGKKSVNGSDVLDTIALRKNRYSLFNDNLSQMITDGSVIISTSDKMVGQINGLTIINTGDCSFGKPVRITANTFVGKSGITNIEREVAMSGTTHSKGVFILSAYIGEKYAQDFPLSLTASLCFEQLYNGVDGDSASSTELYAILSSLSGIPIKQSIAVTGSVNQKGEIQPIGGVTEKIEGFYSVCKERGLDGSHGVLIPKQNIKNLTLSKEVLDSIDQGKFHIYPISTIDEGMELLTDTPFGMAEDGKFKEGTISYNVYNKLKKYAENSKMYN
ncbi:MAG: AAA family ATPase [Clostridia bacterium]|nr:AAA family ATPase [Clostridia bacterium]